MTAGKRDALKPAGAHMAVTAEPGNVRLTIGSLTLTLKPAAAADLAERLMGAAVEARDGLEDDR